MAVLEVDAVTVRRGGAEILRGASAGFDEGRCTAVVGPSGAGKTTLLRLLDRLEEPASGVVRFRGKPLPSYDVCDLRRRVGFVQQTPVLLGETVAEDVRTARADADVATLLTRVGLPAAYAARGTADLSGGEAQRVCLARALSVEPQVLLLDEPTSALDRRSADQVEAVLRGLVAGGLSTVVVTHDLAQAERLADDVVVVVGGEVVEQGPAFGVLAAPQDHRTAAFLQAS